MITVQNATLNNLDELVTLFDEYRVFYNKESNLLGATNFLKERIENKESKIFTSHNDKGVMTGFVQLYPIFSSTRMKRLWLLNDLFVHPNYRGQGFSVELINKAKELCNASGSCGMILETAKSNLIGNKLYPRTEFCLDDEHNYYYWDTK